ncbi:MAG: hypothetical protein ABGW81_06115 [Paracoccaceae bacterium]
MKYLHKFKTDESGAVTVDWVLLTAAIIGLGIPVVTAISFGVQSALEKIDNGMTVAAYFTFSFDANTE